MRADDWVEKLNLTPHPEGGFFKETYRASQKVTSDRDASTAIYFLLRSQDVSHFHRIDADEIWHFYSGSPVFVHILHANGQYETIELGHPERPNFQAIVPAHTWFGATVEEENSYALVGCTVAPGFEFDGFELAERNILLKDFPEQKTLIKRLTKA